MIKRTFAALILSGCFLTTSQLTSIENQAKQAGVATAECVLQQVCQGNTSAASLAVVCLLPDVPTAIGIAGQLAADLEGATGTVGDAGLSSAAYVKGVSRQDIIARLRSVR
jgi:hypothetical protein